MSDKRELFEQSSQFRHWRYTPSSLSALRAANNQQGIARVRQSLLAESSLDGNSARTAEAENNMLTPADELGLINYYLQKIRDYATVYKFNSTVKATAITFMKRFYLHNVVFDYPPKGIMLACLYLATKVENSFVKIDDFTKPLARTKVTNSDVLDYEFVVTQSLQFDLAVHHPYRPAYGFFLDMQTYVEDITVLQKTYELAQKYIDQAVFTDLVFYYQPAQIALGAIKLAAVETRCDVDQYLTSQFDARALESLYPILDNVQEEIRKYQPVSMKEAQVIDRKLILCRNPEKNPSSSLYKSKNPEVPYVSDSDSD
ncbi:cyclin-like protein [Linderina pennispora]|uniref:Cyclin-like protein n=1 Tax=Linderina pennispora TaxID=61395 RepID=A0A1Y1W046_9FUNG|nr:cyclin-like protein [Linderina pennispora]ORX66881.1 cyclin-like protein [Linderina pennispora]